MSGRMIRRLRGFSPLERDDAAIDALARRAPDRDEPDDAIRLLAAWCQRIDEVPAPTADVLTAVVDRLPSRPSRWSFARSAAAATLVVSALLLGGVHAAEQARPGSTFWPLTQMFDRDRARSLVAFQRADGYLTHANTALEEGQVTSAATAVVQARAVIGEVRPEDGRPALAVRLAMLEGRISSLARNSAAAPGQPPHLAHPTTSGGASSTASPPPGGASADPAEGSASTPSAPPAGTSSGTGGVGGGSGTGAPPGADLGDSPTPTPSAPGSPSPSAPPESAEPVGDDDTSASTKPKTPKNTAPNKKPTLDDGGDGDSDTDGMGDTNGQAEQDTDGDVYGSAHGNADGQAGGNAGGNANGQDRARQARGWSAPPATSA